ncbi:MAG: ROK family protein [Christensenellaceae bacterium]|nr:ROK family protein [Christensenellaceae bacterium]
MKKTIQIAGIDIGGTKCAVLHADYSDGECHITSKNSFKTADYKNPMDALAKMEELLSLHPFSAIGISCGGPLDSKKGIILSPPNLPGWDEINIKEYFEEKFAVPCHINNDANACALAEWKIGAGKGMDNVIFMTFGTGLGAGLILDGKLFAGTNDMAGEIGHVRLSPFGSVGYGKAGSAEGFCSGSGIRQLALSRLLELKQLGIRHFLHEKGEELSAYDVFLAARKGDALAKDIIHITGEKLGEICAILVDLLNPEAIVIGSIYARNEDLLFPIANEVLRKESLALSYGCVKILPAALGEEIGDYAALMCAI